MKIFMKKFYVDITHKSQQRDKKTVEQVTKVIISEDNLEYFLKVLDNMSDITVENSIDGIADFKLSQGITRKLKTILFHLRMMQKKSRITFFHAMEKKYMLCMECQWVAC